MNPNQNPLRRIASNKLLLPNGQQLIQHVVEIRYGFVEKYYPLNREQPQTEWWSGCISLKADVDGRLRAVYEGKYIE